MLDTPITLSIVIPVYNEGEGLFLLVDRLKSILGALDFSAEVVLVDDHSADKSPEILQRISAENPAFHWLRLSRNSGSHVAVFAGLEHARGDVAVFMAADLQDPPELIPKMLDLWRQGNSTVWAVRARREGVPLIDRVISRLFYWLLNRFGEVTFPPDGADFALIDRRVIDALKSSVGSNLSILGEIAKLGFPTAEVPYTKEARQFGATKWNRRKKLKAFADAFVSFSYAPMRAMSYLGLICSTFGFLYAAVLLIVHSIHQTGLPGYASLMVVVLVIGGIQMIMLGVLGEYLWRTLEEARHRPSYFVERSSIQAPGPASRNTRNTPVGAEL
jgi:glycosyltransferase involved in cell wall biosynthesis